MLHHIKRVACVLVISTFGVAACAETQAKISTPSQMAVETLLAKWNSDNAPGVALAISLNGKRVLASGHGIANLEYDIPITADTGFHAASVSKQFTAFSILLLVSQGQLSLDDDIRDHLPELEDRGQLVTIRHLLDHMSGYREVGVLAGMAGWLPDDIQTNEQFMRLVSRQTGENFTPGVRVEYSNTGYFLLAQIVERVSGQSFSAFTKERIFDPLKMENTHFISSRTELMPGHAESYVPTEDGFQKFLLMSENIGSTGLKTTAVDLLKWAENFTTQEVGDTTVFSLMAERVEATNGKPSIFGRGQELREYNGLRTWSHGGRDAGFRSFLLRVPEEQFAVSILSNRADFDTAESAFQLVDAYLSGSDDYEVEAERSWQTATPESLEKLSGTYELYPGLLFEISNDGEALLFAPFGSDEATALQQVGPSEYLLSPQANISLIFETDPTGRSVAFDYTIGLHGSLHAPRIELQPFTPGTANLEDYTGTYYSPELTTEYEISVQDNKLTVSHLRLGSATMRAYQPDTFSAPEGFAQRFKFLRGTKGLIEGVLISGAVATDVRFHRVNWTADMDE